MAKQGFKETASNVYIYQEQTASAAIGLDSADSNKFKINASSTTGATATGSSSIIIDGSTNGDITLTPKGTGNLVVSGVYLNAVSTTVGVTIIDSTGVLGSTAQGADDTVLIGQTGGSPIFSDSPSVTKITINDAPVDPTDGANKSYVDAVASGFTFVAQTLVATTANLTATYANGAAGVGATLTNSGVQAALSIDGVALSLTNRVLVKDQTTQFQNGIYTVTTVGTGATNWVLTRATDYDQAAEIFPGQIIPVTSGTVNANTSWLQTETVTTIGTDPIIFIPFTLNGSSFLLKADNLSDVASASASRSNLGLTNVATQNVVQHAVIVGGSADALTSLTVGTTGQVLIGSSAADPAFGALGVNSGLTQHGVLLGQNNSAITAVTNGTTGQVLVASTGADPAWGTVSLTSGVTGVLPIANGGTNASSMATVDGVVYYDGTRLVTTSVGTVGQVLTSNGAGMAPTFENAGSGSGAVIVTVYDTPGAYTWTANASTKVVEIFGWGGGGAGGILTNPLVNKSWGGGGGGTMYYKVPIQFLNSPVSGVVGLGGSNYIFGRTGNGQPSTFGSFSTGPGGFGGGAAGDGTGAGLNGGYVVSSTANWSFDSTPTSPNSGIYVANPLRFGNILPSAGRS